MAYLSISAGVKLRVLSFLLAQGKFKFATVVGPFLIGKGSNLCDEDEKEKLG